FFEVTTEKTDKSQAVGERGIPPLKERRVGHPASIPNGWFSKEKFTNGAGAASRSVSWRRAHPGPGTQVGSIVADGQLEVCDGAYRIFVMKEKSKAPPFASRWDGPPTGNWGTSCLSPAFPAFLSPAFPKKSQRPRLSLRDRADSIRAKARFEPG